VVESEEKLLWLRQHLKQVCAEKKLEISKEDTKCLYSSHLCTSLSMFVTFLLLRFVCQWSEGLFLPCERKKEEEEEEWSTIDRLLRSPPFTASSFLCLLTIIVLCISIGAHLSWTTLYLFVLLSLIMHYRLKPSLTALWKTTIRCGTHCTRRPAVLWPSHIRACSARCPGKHE